MQISQCYVAAAAVALLSIVCNAKNVVVFEPHNPEPDSGPSSHIVTFQDNAKESYNHKPLKLDQVPKQNTAAHPYTYEDSNLDTYPYVASVTPAYTPPILKFGNSKLDHVGSDHGLHHNFPSHPTPPWGKLVRVLTAAIPIGIFLAALPPNIVNINAAQSVKPLGTGTGGQRQRSEVEGPEQPVHTFPVLDMIERLGGLSALEHPGCEAHIFCQMSRLGASPDANTVQRTLWTMAHETPDVISELLGARELLKAVRTDACSLYKCPKPLKDPSVKPTF